MRLVEHLLYLGWVSSVNADCSDTFQRPISYHRILEGVYSKQCNALEADYVADLVKALLETDSGKSIGVVTFSQPQQKAIEEALERRSEEDKAFKAQLEQEEERVVDGQFSGLFVKNLENVQGDERDIIIVSVGYAPNPSGRMIMNFGPINQAGGEKRLNVIFSRAKHHMVVVSSIEHHQITNDHNVGAHALKQYLRYAAAACVGDRDELRRSLMQFGAGRTDWVDNTPTTALADHLQRRLQGRGYDVELGYGQSTITTDLAVRRSSDEAFDLALFVDEEKHYDVSDLIERYVTRPQIFKAFGWQAEHVLALDWFHPQNRLLDRVDGNFETQTEMARPLLRVVE